MLFGEIGVMGEFVNEDDVVRVTAAAALSCGDFIVIPDGRVGVVQNMRPVAIGETATVKVKGIVAVTAAAALTVPCVVGINLTTKKVNAAGTASTVVTGTLLYSVSSGATAQIHLNEYNKADHSIGASTAAAGSTTTDATVLPAATAEVYPTSAADGTKGVRIHADDIRKSRRLFIGNGVSNAILKVYPPTGGTINGAAANAAFSSVSGKGVILICSDADSNAWLAW
jgi:hypothetical protein